jgi:hypothetical protein
MTFVAPEFYAPRASSARPQEANPRCSVTVTHSLAHFGPGEFKGVQLYKGIFDTFFNLLSKFGLNCEL